MTEDGPTYFNCDLVYVADPLFNSASEIRASCHQQQELQNVLIRATPPHKCTVVISMHTRNAVSHSRTSAALLSGRSLGRAAATQLRSVLLQASEKSGKVCCGGDGRADAAAAGSSGSMKQSAAGGCEEGGVARNAGRWGRSGRMLQLREPLDVPSDRLQIRETVSAGEWPWAIQTRQPSGCSWRGSSGGSREAAAAPSHIVTGGARPHTTAIR